MTEKDIQTNTKENKARIALLIQIKMLKQQQKMVLGIKRATIYCLNLPKRCINSKLY